MRLTESKIFAELGNITDTDAFLSTDEEIKWDRDNGCAYKIYNMFKMFD